MKKLIYYLVLLFPLHVFAFSAIGDVYYFRPTDSILRDVYGGSWVGGKITFEGSVSDSQWYWERVYAFGDVNYLHKNGSTAYSGYKSEIWIVPLSLGLKWRV